jgi:hypothetical protein
MAATIGLTLYEEILLLALDDEKGTTGMESGHALGMGGAVLAELMLLGALSISADKKKLVDAAPRVRVSDPLLAECLALVTAAKRRKSASDWVQKFSGVKDLRNRVARGLVVKGVLAEDRDKVLGLFPRTIFPARNPGPERAMIERLQRAVLTDVDKVDERTLVTVAIAQATDLLRRAVDKKQLKTRKARLKQLAEGQLAGAATAEAVQAVTAAVMLAVVAATTASAAAHH